MLRNSLLLLLLFFFLYIISSLLMSKQSNKFILTLLLLHAGQPFIKSTRRKQLKGSKHCHMRWHSSAACCGFTMRCLNKTPHFSSLSTLWAASLRLFTLPFSFSIPPRRLGYRFDYQNSINQKLDFVNLVPLSDSSIPELADLNCEVSALAKRARVWLDACADSLSCKR